MNNDDLKGQAYGRGLGLPGCQAYSQDELDAAVKAAVDAERERCAKLCEETGAYTDELDMALMCAAAIREAQT